MLGVRNLRDNKHSRVCHLTRRIAHWAFFPNADERLIDVMKRSASFDRAYAYDDFDRLSTNGAFAEGYTYDALGRRVSTTTREGTTRHVYDNNWQVVADIDEQGNVVASYVWGEGIDNLLAVTVGGATYYALADIQGTVWGYVDEYNNIVARWAYDAWGNVLSEEIDSSAVALSRIRCRFQGREWSAATGLINFRMRWYDAETGRWLSKDPIGLSGGLNLYAFCGGDSINYMGSIGTRPPTAEDYWYKGKVPNGFSATKEPQWGDVISDGRHVGLVSEPGKTSISASAIDGQVVENDWGSREGDNDNIKAWHYAR